MYCESCGTQNDESTQFCENCGASLGTPSSAPAPYTPDVPPVSQGTSPEGMIYARIGVVVGVLGIFLFFFFILGPIAIILGYVGYTKGDVKTGKIAMILGAVGTLISLLVSLVFI
jgi:hypothetical protein